MKAFRTKPIHTKVKLHYDNLIFSKKSKILILRVTSICQKSAAQQSLMFSFRFFSWYSPFESDLSPKIFLVLSMQITQITLIHSQPGFTNSKSTMKAPEQCLNITLNITEPTFTDILFKVNNGCVILQVN